MTITELVAQYRMHSKDNSLPYFTTDAELALLFREAEKQACLRKELIFDSTTAEVCEITVTEELGATYAIHSVINRIDKAYLVDANSAYTYLKIKSRDWLDDNLPLWREETGDPEFLIVDELSVQIVPAPEDSYTMHLEVYRCPLNTEEIVAITVDPDSTPTIAPAHHDKLYHWPMYLVHGMMDEVDTYNPVRSARHEKAFSDYFGPSPDSNRKRLMREDVPHINKIW